MNNSTIQFNSGGGGWLIGAISLIGNIAAVTVGVPASTVVANQCIRGRSFEKFLVFNGCVQLKDRYDGMREAFGLDRELFIPERRGGMTFPELTSENFIKLIESADKKFRDFNRHKHDILPNRWLKASMVFPQFQMGLAEFGCFITVLYTGLVLLPIPLVSIIWWLDDRSYLPQAAYALLFMLVSIYDGALLDVRRSVCYIKVPKGGGGPRNQKFDALWAQLQDRAVKTPPDSPSAAIEDLANGRVRRYKGGEELLVPVMALKPSVEFNIAMASLTVTHLRGPVLALSCQFVTPASHLMYLGICAAACLQASLHRLSANYFGSNTEPCDILWFRRLPGPGERLYPEHTEYQMDLR